MAVQLRNIMPWLVLCSFALPVFAHAAAINPPPNNLGLVGYWTFDEGAGTKAADHSGNGNTGAFTSGSPTWVSGKLGNALQFTRNTSAAVGYVQVPDSSSLEQAAASSFTVSFWLNPSNNYGDGGNDNIIEKSIDSASPGWGIYRTSAGLLDARLACTTGVNGCVARADVTLNFSTYFATSTWTHVVLVVNKGTNLAQWYINGVAIGSATNISNVSSMLNTRVLNIGAGAQGLGVDTFGGNIDEVRLYGRALSATEVSALYQTSAALVGGSQSPGTLANGLVGWWTLDGKDITTSFVDRSGNGFNGYLVGNNNATSSRKTIGKIGQGFSFGGQNTGGIDLGTSNSLTPSTFTIAGWIYYPNTSSCYNYIYSNQRDVSGTNGIDFKIYCSGQLSGVIKNGGTANSVTYAMPASLTGKWVHVAFVVTGSKLFLYVNGVVTGGGTTQTITPGTPADFHTCIGSMGNSNCTTYTLNGKLDDVRLYNRALSSSEIDQLYASGQGTTANASSAKLQLGSSIASGLVGFWTFNGADVTTSILDKSGSGNNGYLFNGATSTAQTIGKSGQAFYFNGSDYVDAGPGLTTTLNGSFSFSFWVKRTRTGQELVAGHDTDTTGSSNASLVLGFRPTTNKFTFAFWANDLDSTTAIADANWHLISGTYDATTNSKKIYIDGRLDNSNTPTSDYIGTGDLCIGGGCSGWGNSYFKGSLDDFRIYNRVLSATEISQLYNMGK